LKVEVKRWDSLAEARENAKHIIDQQAERTRLKYITPGSGQAMEYEAAVREAERFMAGEQGSFPMLQADVSAGLAPTLVAAAQLVLGMRAAWEPLGAGIRTIRLSAKRQVDLATTQAQVAQIREQAVAQLLSL